MTSENNQLPIVTGIWPDGSLKIEVLDRLKMWWQCKNCGEFMDDYQKANEHTLKCSQYEDGDKVEFLFRDNPKVGPFWIKGVVDGTGEDRSGRFVIINTCFGAFTLMLGETLIRKKSE